MGWHNAYDFVNYFSYYGHNNFNFLELIKFWNDSDDDDRLTYNDFHRATTGFLLPYGYEDHLDYRCAHRAEDLHHDTFNQPYRSSYFLYTK
jgi:hypothetical protein